MESSQNLTNNRLFSEFFSAKKKTLDSLYHCWAVLSLSLSLSLCLGTAGSGSVLEVIFNYHPCSLNYFFQILYNRSGYKLFGFFKTEPVLKILVIVRLFIFPSNFRFVVWVSTFLDGF